MKQREVSLPLAGLIGLLLWCAVAGSVAWSVASSTGRAELAGPLTYPAAVPGAVADDYHGERVADPWRWLETQDSPETLDWVAQQNRLTQQVIGRLPGRERFAKRLRALFDYERRGVPDRESGVYVHAWNPGHAEQDSLRVSDDPGKPGAVLLDPLTIRADGTLSIDDFELSPDGRLLAYALSDGGSDWKTWRIRDVRSAVDLPDTLAGTKFTPVSWSRDSRGFYYSRYPGSDAAGYDDGRQVAVYFHVPGTPQASDALVYAIADHATRDPYAVATPDGRFLLLNIEDGYLSNALYYRHEGVPGQSGGLASGPIVKLVDSWDARYDFLGAIGDTFYLLTTNAAPRGRVIAVDLATPAPRHWREVVPQTDDAIEAAALIGAKLVVQYIHDVGARITLYPLDGGSPADAALPGQGSVADLHGTPSDPEGFLTYSDFTTPRSVYRLDTGAGEVEALLPVNRAAGSGAYISEQVFYTSSDGTRVPMTISRRRDVQPGGSTPTVLYGYGGFNVSLLPTWSASRMAWIEAGGIYAQANIRGGGEYGEAWHLAGTRLNKQNVFNDFIAAAEWLIGNGYTSPEHLAIWGGSNGGLLVAAVLNQRPELFAAAIPAVGVLDMLRYHTASLNARKWSSDYGLSENPEEFVALRAYSPYHNILQGVCYPAVLVQADANDDRVMAWHSYKYTAALQAAQSSVPGCRNPVLVRVEVQGGHGAGASLSKRVSEYADQWLFVATATGLTWFRPSPD